MLESSQVQRNKMDTSSVEVRVLSEDCLQGAREMMLDNIYHRHPIFRCLNDTREAYGRRFSSGYVRKCMENGLSVVAVDTANGDKVVGLSLIRLEPHFLPEEHHTRLYKVKTKMVADLFELVNVSAILGAQADNIPRLSTGVVCEEYTRRGIYTQLVELQKKLLKERNIPYVEGIFVSKYSRKMALKLGFEMVASIKYSVFEYEGEKPFLPLVEEHEEVSLGLLKVLER